MSIHKASVIEHVKMWRIPTLPRLELMRATYIKQSFTRHTHEGFAVGVIENGALGFFYRGEKEMGLPPHGYLKQARVRKARNLLSRGWSIAAAAMEAGFADQSHLTRNFKHIFGITPGQFSNFVQDTHNRYQHNE
jgi:methylphosphotriester-DNA--protein-cysteine methyltransferase